MSCTLHFFQVVIVNPFKLFSKHSPACSGLLGKVCVSDRGILVTSVSPLWAQYMRDIESMHTNISLKHERFNDQIVQHIAASCKS